MFEELKKFNFVTYTSILYLSIADGMNNPDRLRQLYSKHVLIRYGYTLFGAYNVFGLSLCPSSGAKFIYFGLSSFFRSEFRNPVQRMNAHI